jgi:hypothetical protein
LDSARRRWFLQPGTVGLDLILDGLKKLRRRRR